MRHSGPEPNTVATALAALKRRRIWVDQPGSGHLKFRALTFYPKSGILTLDGRGRLAVAGFHSFLERVEPMFAGQYGPDKQCADIRGRP